MSARKCVVVFLILSAVMFLFNFPLTGPQAQFNLVSEMHVNGMLAAGVLDVDFSGHDFGLNIISCDGIVWAGEGKNVDGKKRNDTLYLVYHAPEYIGYDTEIASTRNQQVGIQGWLAYYVGRMYKIIRLHPKYYYQIFRVFNASVLIIVLTGITLQLMKAYSTFFALCFYFVYTFSSWIVSFSTNLYWMEFTWFIPLLLGLICMNRPEKRFWIYPLIALSVAFKSMCGYEYISTVMMLPEVFILSEYFASRGIDKKRANLMLRITVGVGISALAGFVAALLYHSYIRGGGDILSGLNEIYTADILRRTFGNASDFPGFENAMNASITGVLTEYFILRPDGWLSSVLVVLSGVSIFYAHKKHFPSLKRDLSLLILSFLCSISWIVLAKSHSYSHHIINYVLFYMPFIPTALYIFLKYRVITLIPDNQKRTSLINFASSLIGRIFWLS